MTTMEPTSTGQKHHGGEDDVSVGSLRFESDKREFAGLLLLISFCAIIQPLYATALQIGTDNTTTADGTPFAVLFGYVWVLASGICCFLMGYYCLVHGLGSKALTALLILFIQVSYIAYISEMVAVGFSIRNFNPAISIPPVYAADAIPGNDPTNITNRRYFATMGILGIMSYGVSLIGSLTFFLLCLMAYQTKKPYKQNRAIYKGHLGAFSFVLFIAGLSQFLLGCYVVARFNRLAGGSIVAGYYIVSRPGIAIYVGILQLLGGLAGMIHGYGIRSMWGDVSDSFVWYMLFTWLSQVVLQAWVQAAYPRSALGAGFATTVMPFTVPLNLVPAYLAYKAGKVPDDIRPEYYGFESSHHGGNHRPEDTEPAEHDEPGVVPISRTSEPATVRITSGV